MTSCTDQQIIAAYEVNNMTPEQISEDMGFTVEGVKAKLMSISTKYRKSCGMECQDEDEINFSRDEQVRIKNELYNLAMGTEDEHLKGKLLLQLRDDGKGRKDVVKQMGSTTFNMFQFNDMLQQARNGANRIRQMVQPGNDTQKLIEA